MAPSVSYSITVRLEVASPDEIGPHYIVPSVFHPEVVSSVAVAVADAAARQPDRS
jgi:malic enzyme